MINGMYGRAYGTLVANVENLTPQAQGGGLSPLQLSRWTGNSEFATVATMNTPPTQASPSVPFPGQPQYGLQQGPNYAPITGYGGLRGGYGGAWSNQNTAFQQWTGGGGWLYLLDYSDGKIVAKGSTQTKVVRPGNFGYKEILTEALNMAESDTVSTTPLTRMKLRQFLDNAPAQYTAPEIVSTTPRPATPSAGGSAAPGASKPDAPPPPPPPPVTSGFDLPTKIALGVLAVSLVGGAAYFVMRRRKG